MLALSLLKCDSCYYVKYVDMDHMVVTHMLLAKFLKFHGKYKYRTQFIEFKRVPDV